MQRGLPMRAGIAGFMMEVIVGDLVNLKRFRKRAEREQSESTAAARRARFGRTRSKREADEARTLQANKILDQHRVDGEDA